MASTRPLPFPFLAALPAAIILAAPAAGQSGEPQGEPPPAAAPAAPRAGARPEMIDIRTRDPHEWRALAVRLPDGQAPRLDGVLDDPVWQLAPAHGDFIQRDPDVGMPSTHDTEFRILYDDDRIYVGVWAFEPHEGGVIASELERDALLRKGDAVRVTFDTFHDHRTLFYFSTNPLGVFKDGHVTDNTRMNWDWNAVWDVKATADEQGWYSEFEIPLSQLRFRDQDEQVWGINVVRMLTHQREESSYVPMPREWGNAANYRASGSGLLLGLDGIQPRRRFEFIPFVSPAVVRDYDAGTPTDWTSGFGADLRVGLTQTLNADLTFRTDFAQVEADQEVVNLSRFSLFFPEKRQFFTEGAGTFAYGGGGGRGGAGPLGLFYSRRIGLSDDGKEVPILAGGRITGNPGAYTIGLLNVQTDPVSYALGDSVVGVPRGNYTVARVKRNVLSASSVGLIALNRQGEVGGSAYNRSIGIDGVFNLPHNVQVVSLLAKTFSPGASGRDLAGHLSVDWSGDLFGLNGSYTDIQEGFNAEMGFIPRLDMRQTSLGANWTPRPDWPGVRQLNFGATMNYIENHRGVLETRERELSAQLMRDDEFNVRAGVSDSYDLLPTPFRVGPNTVAPGAYAATTFSSSFRTDQTRRVYGGGGVDVGGYYGGRRLSLNANLSFLTLETLLFENDYTRNRITMPGAPSHVTNTINTRVTYSVSPTLFLKAFVQYNDDRRLTNLNLLLWSVYRPGSDLYIVYNQGWETGLGPDGPRVRSRSLAIKFTYWLSR